MSGRSVGAVVLVGALLLGGCASTDVIPAGPTTIAIDGLRSDPDHRGFLASYIGGACDGPARLAATETTSRIELSVLIGPDPHGAEVCSAVGISRTVATRLTRPIGNRAIWSQGRRQIPFDGARLLVPTSLPSGFTASWSRSALGQDDSAVPEVTTGWTTTYTERAGSIVRDRCEPGRGSLAVDIQARTARDFVDEWAVIATLDVGSAKARLYREGSSSTPTGLAYVWTADQGRIDVVSRTACEGDQLLSRVELLRVARSLPPA